MPANKTTVFYSLSGSPHISQLEVPPGFTNVQCRHATSVSAGVIAPDVVPDRGADGVWFSNTPIQIRDWRTDSKSERYRTPVLNIPASVSTMFNVFQPSICSSMSVFASGFIATRHSVWNSSFESVCVEWI